MVAAVDSFDLKADFSDYHAGVFLCAPGTGVRSAYPGGEWGIGAGCSFATPLVAAAAALVMSADPGVSRFQVLEQLAKRAHSIQGLPGNAGYEGKLGAGRLHLLGARLAEPAAVEVLPAPCIGSASPNPFVDAVRFHLRDADAAAPVSLVILDAGGRLVRSLSPEATAALYWDGRDQQGRRLRAGAYWARVRTPEGLQVIPLRLLR
jgi:subtilisin family serine protease